MPLVRHRNGYRRIWMFPRNIRRISPWKMAQILSLFIQHVRYDDWAGNQPLQNSFAKALEQSGLKQPGTQYDPHSGGPRTYFAQLRCLGLLFDRDGRIFTTKAGEDLAKGMPPLPIMQSMLLNHQYPSTYGTLQNVRMNPDMKVKPFLFVLKLLNHPEIGHLTNQEIAVPVIFGHRNDCLELCVRKILSLRSGASFLDILEDRVTDLYLPRSSGSNPIANIIDIANTCKNYLQACCFIVVEAVDGRDRITFSDEMREIYESALLSENDFMTLQTEESFQRAYGSWDRLRDTRRLEEAPARTVSPEESIILAQYYRLCGENMISHLPETFVEQLRNDFGFDRTLIRDTVQPHLGQSLDFFESTFLELSKGGASKATQFEKAICNLFNEKLHFRAKHTGQLSRRGVGGYSDVFAIALDDIHCAIIDAKASASYSLPASDYLAMSGNYIPNYLELGDGRDLRLEFCMYVAGGFVGEAGNKIRTLKEESGIGCSGIRARDLLYLAKKNPSAMQQPAMRSKFCSGIILDNNSFADL